jgi:alpha-tubulin suppressor-like RCC1 family protein
VKNLNGKKICSIGCGQYHTITASEDDEVYSFGRNDSGQLGILPYVNSESQPTLIDGFQASQVSCGYYHSIGLYKGKVFSWGRNDSG